MIYNVTTVNCNVATVSITTLRVLKFLNPQLQPCFLANICIVEIE